MRASVIWAAMLALGGGLVVASCGESTQNSPESNESGAGQGGGASGGAPSQAGGKQPGLAGGEAMSVAGEDGGGVGGAPFGPSGGESGAPTRGGEGGAIDHGGAGATAAGASGAAGEGGGAGQAGGTGGSGGDGNPVVVLPPQCTNHLKDANEQCVDCGGPCPACNFVMKCTDALCEGSGAFCAATGYCPTSQAPASCPHLTACETPNAVPDLYLIAVKDGCSPGMDDCRQLTCKCSCPD